MSWVILLFVVGTVLLAAEVIVPGAILGMIGGLLLFAGCVTAFQLLGGTVGFIAVAIALSLAGVAIALQFYILPRTRLGKRAFLTREMSGTSNNFSAENRGLVGATAEALTRLTPTGYVMVDGRRCEAFCDSGQVPEGTHLKVIAVDNFRLVVTPVTAPTSEPVPL